MMFITQEEIDRLCAQSYERGKQEGYDHGKQDWKIDVFKTINLYATKNEDRKHTFILKPINIAKGGSLIINGDTFFFHINNNGGTLNINGNAFFPGKIINEEGSQVVFINHDHLKDRVVNEE